MATSKKDRRVERTRQLLRQAFMELMREKGFAAMSVQDITDRAGVNRGTFYIHFADKYLLLDEIVRDNFGQLLASALPSEPRWDENTLRVLIRTVLSCLERKYHHRQPPSRLPSSLLERAIHEELTKLLSALLKQVRGDRAQGQVKPETIARIIGSAIFGAAIQWSQEPAVVPLEEMAGAILLVVMQGAGTAVMGSGDGAAE